VTAARERMIVALDVDDPAAAIDMVARIGDAASFYKIGYQLAFGGGLPLARDLAASGRGVFLDMKLHDIGQTVAKGVERIAALGVTYLTVHAYPQTMRAAAAAARGSGLKILAVTVLTSWDQADAEAAGYGMPIADLVARRADQALEAGVDGLILSPVEVAAMRARVGDTLELITPGVRPAGADKGDQKRVMTPGEAIAAGADRLVVGRPVTHAPDPRAAAAAIVAEIAAAPTPPAGLRPAPSPR
jgi:orotidine-5'-phosphate decarboxylase